MDQPLRFTCDLVRYPVSPKNTRIALVRLDAAPGGRIIVRDRSKKTHISEYVEGFLNVRRVNAPDDLCGKLNDAVKDSYKQHRADLAPDVRQGGVPGYEEFVRAITRTRHREHKAMLAWHGGPCNPDDMGEAEIVAALGKLARRRTLGRAAYLQSAGRQN